MIFLLEIFMAVITIGVTVVLQALFQPQFAYL